MNIKNSYLLLASLILVIFLSVDTNAMSNKRSENNIETNANLNSSNSAKIAPADSVWIGKSNLAKSCTTEKGVDIDLMSKELTNSGIKIYARKIIPIETMQLQSCGIDKGDMNSYLIHRNDLEKSLQLGFKTLK